MNYGSKKIARIALRMAISETREEENQEKKKNAAQGIRSGAVDFGGEYLSSINKIVEHAIVAGKREGIIGDSHSEEGAIAGATREALSQIQNKAIGLNVGGKLGIARYQDHLSIAVFLGVGLLHLDEVAVGLAHRTIS
ncbi:MAG: HutP family protein [Peptococcaceae bacterium]|nr:HutP family protein [Peptococcaceae bacterium]